MERNNQVERVCSHCGKTGHVRRSHSNCDANPQKMAAVAEMLEASNQTQQEQQTEQNETVAHRRPISFLNIAKDPSQVPLIRDNRGSMSVECKHCGAFMWMEERSKRSSKRNPYFQLCCCKGQVILLPLKPTPPLIANLLKSNEEQGKEFKKHLRSYNNCLSFTSLGVNLDEQLANSSVGAYTFRIQGEAYHLIGSALPADGRSPSFAQIYIYDTEHELENRLAICPQVNPITLSHLQDLLHVINPFVPLFKSMSEVSRDQQALTTSDPTQIQPGINGLNELKIIFRAEGAPDKRRYNRPTQSEIGAIIVGGGGSNHSRAEDSKRDIVVRQRNGGALTRISELNQYYDPLHYVIMFPEGDAGWNIALTAFANYETAVLASIFVQDGNNMEVDSIANEQVRRRSNNVTSLQYYSYRLMYRPKENHCMHLFGRLFHQYIVDMYAKIEQTRLKYIYHNQERLRSELYRNLVDAVNETDGVSPSASNDGQTDSVLRHVGMKTILPSSFIGGPRHMVQLYQDAISIVRIFVKPDYFITFTCNPAWPEIQNELLFGQMASERPDLCARVFNMKLEQFLDDISKKNVLGRVLGLVYTIEFQKRGLPHMHMLVIVHPDDKPRTVEDFDRVVSAELPNESLYPLAYQTISRNMIHGPCGRLNPNAICMDKKTGKCTKDYPKRFSPETVSNEDHGYPVYRRRNDQRFVEKGRPAVRLDNRWIVPHNLWLATKYDAHINVEICSSVSAIKYIYKYIYKGHDRATATIEEQDEIKKFLDARYVSAPEACWRIFSFGLHKEYPSHQRLAIHLEDEQRLYFDETEDPEAVLRRGEMQETTLTAWFKMNSSGDEVAKDTYYHEFPEHFVWCDSAKPRKWKRRERGFGGTIGRIYNVSPAQTEKFHLRMILYHVKGATSFRDLRTVDGVEYPTFKEACFALGLLESDEQWSQCLEEAATFRLPVALRSLFCAILCFCDPAEPYQLWQHFKDELSDDIYFQLSNNPLIDSVLNDLRQLSYQHCLLEINDRLTSGFNIDLSTIPGFELPSEDTRADVSRTDSSVPKLIRHQQRLINLAMSRPRSNPGFNEDQKAAFDTISQYLCVTEGDCPEGRVVFIDGPGGTGKTFLLSELLSTVRCQGDVAIAVASSGTAALLLEGGRTAHSTFAIPVNDLGPHSTCFIKRGDQRAALIKMAKMIIWDECSMVSRFIFDAVDRSFRDVMAEDNESLSHVPFGGKLMIFGGDFRQVLPVVPKGSRAEIVNQCINRSHLWKHVKTLKLRINMRVQQALIQNDNQQAEILQRFADYLLNVGDDEIPHELISVGNFASASDQIKISPSQVVQSNDTLDLIKEIFPSLFSLLSDITSNNAHGFMSSAILTPKNSDAQVINEMVLEKFLGRSKTYLSADSVSNEEQRLEYPVEFLNSIQTGSLPPHCLTLKIGAPIMMLRNLDPENGLCNGTRLTVLNMLNNVIEAKIITGANIGHVVYIPRIKLFSSETDSAVSFRRVQFPVRLAFAMTINKAQGQTLDRVGLYLPSPVFSHGQLYVAMSRVKRPDCIKVFLPNSNNHSNQTQVNYLTRNVVYKEVFSPEQ